MPMTLPQSLDGDLLRAFVLIAEGHSFTRAATLVGRTQSAVSMQVKRLEEQLGQPVLSRGKGGRVELTPHGEYLLTRARQILALNDEVLTTFREPQIAGTVRLGTPDDYALSHLPPILKRFAETHPAVQVDVLCAASDELVARLKAGEVDLALISTRYAPHRQDPLPLALAGPECSWRCAATNALDRAGRRYRIAYVSGSQAGTHAPVVAGLAVTICALSPLPEGLRVVRPDEGLPALPEFGILMLKARRARAPTDALAAHIEESFLRDARRTQPGVVTAA